MDEAMDAFIDDRENSSSVDLFQEKILQQLCQKWVMQHLQSGAARDVGVSGV